MPKPTSEGRKTVRASARPEYKIIARILRDLRDEKGIGQEPLSHQIGRTKNFIGKVENEEQPIDFVAILDICDAIGVDPAEVVAQVHAEAKKKRKG